MLKFYFNGSPNPTKVALFLEEAGLPYEPNPIDTRKGQQFDAAFLAVNPNGKVPAIVDGDTTVFDSSAILLYLAEKTGKFLPAPSARGELLSWLMFVATGIGPFSGQGVHFRHFAPEKVPYAHNRYQFEAERHYGILEARLAKRRAVRPAKDADVELCGVPSGRLGAGAGREIRTRRTRQRLNHKLSSQRARAALGRRGPLACLERWQASASEEIRIDFVGETRVYILFNGHFWPLKT